jgi:hypothetical protein
MSSVSFVDTQFVSLYQRNSKKAGKKNLRCFPDCGHQHKHRGFCGRSIKVSVVGAQTNAICIGQFLVAVSENENNSGVNPKIGDIINYSDVVRLENGDSKREPLFIGERLQNSSVYEFNRKLKGWQYGWVANKGICNTEHVFKVHVYELLPGHQDSLICRAIVMSPPFILFCSRRQRFTKQPTAQKIENDCFFDEHDLNLLNSLSDDQFSTSDDGTDSDILSDTSSSFMSTEMYGDKYDNVDRTSISIDGSDSEIFLYDHESITPEYRKRTYSEDNSFGSKKRMTIVETETNDTNDLFDHIHTGLYDSNVFPNDFLHDQINYDFL